MANRLTEANVRYVLSYRVWCGRDNWRSANKTFDTLEELHAYATEQDLDRGSILTYDPDEFGPAKTLTYVGSL